MPLFKPKTNKALIVDTQKSVTLDNKHNEIIETFQQQDENDIPKINAKIKVMKIPKTIINPKSINNLIYAFGFASLLASKPVFALNSATNLFAIAMSIIRPPKKRSCVVESTRIVPVLKCTIDTVYCVAPQFMNMV